MHPCSRASFSSLSAGSIIDAAAAAAAAAAASASAAAPSFACPSTLIARTRFTPATEQDRTTWRIGRRTLTGPSSL
uniref:Putative secreted protein n=1 Tax=Anopheles triannulatus TaxID=58253 RepID=A0A2M4B1B7_9DIPT